MSDCNRISHEQELGGPLSSIPFRFIAEVEQRLSSLLAAAREVPC
jgi:hypothetical protein